MTPATDFRIKDQRKSLVEEEGIFAARKVESQSKEYSTRLFESAYLVAEISSDGMMVMLSGLSQRGQNNEHTCDGESEELHFTFFGLNA